MPDKPIRIRRYRWGPSGRRAIREHLATIKKFLHGFMYYPHPTDDEILDFCMLPFVTLHWKHSNPIWLQVIGPPGSGKTAHVTLTKNYRNSIFVSSLSKATLISGYRKENDEDFDPSLLPLLDGKVLIVKDFTTILQAGKEERDAVIGQLRDIFDGSASRGLGNVGLVEFTSRFNMLLCVTPAIDQYHSIGQQLGERFISRREYATNRLAITKAAIRNVVTGREDTRFAEARRMVHTFLDKMPEVSISDIVFPDEILEKIQLSCDFAAKCRSHVYREKDGRSVATRPSPEVATRLSTQIVQCLAGYCIINGLKTVNEKAWQFGGARILRDTLPAAISWVLYHIYTKYPPKPRNHGQKKFFTVVDISKACRMGNAVVEGILTDLFYHAIIERRNEEGLTAEYFLDPEQYRLIENCGIFNHAEEYTHE